jgi:hypothetical protein
VFEGLSAIVIFCLFYDVIGILAGVLNHLIEKSLSEDQLVWSSLLCDLAILHHQNSIVVGDCTQTVGDCDYR